MELSIPLGLTYTQEIKVAHEHTAAYLGSGLVEVLATPAMIALMENTAQLSLQPYLQEGFITLGTEINTRHLKATLVGTIITCRSILIKTEGKRFTFEIHVADQNGDIGIATHERYAVEAKKFMEKLAAQH